MAHILVVEDDKLLGKAMTDSLLEAGYEVSWAKNSIETFEVLKIKKVDLIYLDIMLPEVDGYQILQQVKNDSTTHNIPVVMLTNLGQMSEINQAMGLGATDYLIKANIDLGKLVEMTQKKYLLNFF